MICISCKTEHNFEYCPNCGEKAAAKKLNIGTVIGEAFSTLTNMDKGFLYNLKMLFKNPKNITQSYISGKRKGILNPVSYLILSVTVYLLIENYLRVPPENSGTFEIPENYIGRVAYYTGWYLHEYFKYFWILAIFPLSIATKTISKKYNFIEHLAINSFIMGQATLISIIWFVFTRTEMVISPLTYLYVAYLIYNIYANKKQVFSSVLSCLAVMLVFILQLIIMVVAFGFLMA